MNTPSSLLDWPPAYLIRYSKRAKHVHLSIDPTKGLSVVLPHRAQCVDVLTLIYKKKHWLLKHLSKITPKTYKQAPLPCTLVLQAIGQNWTVQYTEVPERQTTRIMEQPNRLLQMITPSLATTSVHQDKLIHWLKLKAYDCFSVWLKQLSLKHQLPFNRLTIRAQKTLWGSCTHQKNISLNYKLLFLPQPLVTHILLHELAHTRYLNHGIRFKQLLNKLDPNTPAHVRALKTADQYIPDSLK